MRRVQTKEIIYDKILCLVQERFAVLPATSLASPFMNFFDGVH